MRPDRHPEITQHMSGFIRERRAALGLSLDEVADRIGASKSHIWELETGRSKNPTLWMILALCEALQCSLNALIGKDISQPIFTESEMALIDAHRRIFRSVPAAEPVEMRQETTLENIARDMKEGRFPERSEPRMVPLLATLTTEGNR